MDRPRAGDREQLRGELQRHYYADNGSALLGINLIGWDAGGWPFVY